MNLPHFEMKAEVTLWQGYSLTFSARCDSYSASTYNALTASLIHSFMELETRYSKASAGSRKIKA